MTIMLVLMGLIGTLFSRSMGVRSRESRRTDALTSAQAALNILSREIADSGYGLTDNGIVLADSGANRIHFRANIQNSNTVTNEAGEDLTYYFDQPTQSIVRYEKIGNSGTTSAIVNRVSNVTFRYYNYTGSSSTPTITTAPTVDTCRVEITVVVTLDPVPNMPAQTVSFVTDVTLRNSNYMLNQY